MSFILFLAWDAVHITENGNVMVWQQNGKKDILSKEIEATSSAFRAAFLPLH